MAFYCLINRDKRFIVCVNPKCGCTTVKDWFKRTLGPPKPTAKKRRIGEFMISAQDVSGFESYFRFFIIREPLRRLVSFYYRWVVRHSKRWCFADEARKVGLREHTFREFLEALLMLRARGTQFQHHLIPQTLRVRDVPFDEVVRLEDFDERIGPISRRLGVDYAPRRLNAHRYGSEMKPGAFDLPPEALRAEPPHPYQSFYDAELEQVARMLYREDVDYYESIPGSS